MINFTYQKRLSGEIQFLNIITINKKVPRHQISNPKQVKDNIHKMISVVGSTFRQVHCVFLVNPYVSQAHSHI